MSGESANIERLQEKIGYRFKQPELLLQSLTHPSVPHNGGGTLEHNQRLEFLGDAILSAILATELYHILSEEREGSLSRSRAVLARGKQLARLARELGVDAALRLSEGEEHHGGRARPSILEDALEALVGAIFLDSDWETTRRVVLRWYGDLHRLLNDLIDDHNPKGALQEIAQGLYGNDAVEYRLTRESGPAHDKSFEVVVFVKGESMGSGRGGSKKEAEENAAREALLRWQEREPS